MISRIQKQNVKEQNEIQELITHKKEETIIATQQFCHQLSLEITDP